MNPGLPFSGVCSSYKKDCMSSLLFILNGGRSQNAFSSVVLLKIGRCAEGLYLFRGDAHMLGENPESLPRRLPCLACSHARQRAGRHSSFVERGEERSHMGLLSFVFNYSMIGRHQYRQKMRTSFKRTTNMSVQCGSFSR